MLKRPTTTLDRLLAYSVIFEEAARLQNSERAAADLSALADACVRAALAMLSEAAEFAD